MHVADPFDVELRRAELLTSRDHVQRWVIYSPHGWTITTTPQPHKNKYSVRWMPLVGAVSVNYSPAITTHPAGA
jgi:hypothetical protein